MTEQEMIEQLGPLAGIEKQLRRELTTVMWKLVRAESTETEQQYLSELRVLAFKAEQAERNVEAFHRQAKASMENTLERAAANIAQNLAIGADTKAARLAKRRAEIDTFKAEQEAAQAAKEAAEYEQLAAEEKRSAIIMQAISTGRLTEVVETREQQASNNQRRSGGGIVRIESGDGK